MEPTLVFLGTHPSFPLASSLPSKTSNIRKGLPSAFLNPKLPAISIVHLFLFFLS